MSAFASFWKSLLLAGTRLDPAFAATILALILPEARS